MRRTLCESASRDKAENGEKDEGFREVGTEGKLEEREKKVPDSNCNGQWPRAISVITSRDGEESPMVASVSKKDVTVGIPTGRDDLQLPRFRSAGMTSSLGTGLIL